MLKVENIHKDYDGKPLLKGISFEVNEGELVCLLGSSGSGKSTMLRIIAGLEVPESGQISWNGEDITNKPTHERGFGFMFQDYALFPHRTVAQNIAFGLRMAGKPKNQIETLVQKSLANIHMQAFANRQVTELSGGEQQRVALARALAPDPHLLMLDEPLGALDHNLRTELLKELRRRLHESRKPVIYVTHDQEEAFVLADRLLLMHDGLVVQEAAPETVYRQPANAWVASFLGLGNLIPAQSLPDGRLKSEIGEIAFSEPLPYQPGQDFVLLLRPEDAILNQSVDKNVIQMEVIVQDAVFIGEAYRLEVSTGETKLLVQSPRAVRVGEKLKIGWAESKVQCLNLLKL